MKYNTSVEYLRIYGVETVSQTKNDLQNILVPIKSNNNME